MTFSFTAGGTRDQTLASLRKATSDVQVGLDLRDLLVTHLEESASDGLDSTPIRYDVSASGHGGHGQMLTLSVSVASSSYAQPVVPDPVAPDVAAG